MNRLYKFLFFLFLLSTSVNCFSQKIQGTWEGIMDDELLRVSIEQKGMRICGFTHDQIILRPQDSCTAAYSGEYLPESKTWILVGTKFISNSGSHVLMKLLLWEDREYGRNTLRGRVTTGSSINDLMGFGAHDVLLRRVSNKPVKLANGEPNCFPKPAPKPKAIPQPKPVSPPKTVVPTPKPVEPKPPIPKPNPLKPTPNLVKDTVKKAVTQPLKPVVSKPDAELLRKMTARKQSEQSRLEVNVRQINLKVYDNGVVDNDTVSIFYNGKLLLSHQRLSETPIIINLDLDENVTEHKLTMYAENLGGIPPNTALIVVTAGGKRYELRSKASLEENAVLIFDYKPKE